MAFLMQKINKSFTEKEVLNQMNGLRGLMALLIVLGHCGRRFDTEPLLLKGPHLGAFIFVCFFFVVSGWSLAYNYDYRNDYLKGFFKKKILKLMLLTIETEIITQVLQLIFLRKSMYFNRSILLNVNWYIYEMIVLYVVFWISYKFIKQTIAREIVIWIISGFICVGYWLLYKYGSWEGWTFAYYYSALSFPFGIMVHRLYEKAVNKRVWLIIISVILALASAYCIKMPKESFVGGIWLHNILGICSILLLIILLSFVKYKEIKVLKFITKNSTFIYLYQFCVMMIIKEIYAKTGRNIDWLYVLLVLITSVILSEMVFLLNTYISKGEKIIFNKLKRED